MILVFAGAGASKAVNPSEYPTTIEFFEKLPQDIAGDTLYRLVVEYLGSQRRHIKIIDIEHVLWALGELRSFLQLASDGSSVPGWFLRGRLLQPLNQTSDFGNIVSGGGNVLALADQLVARINEQVYAWYSREPIQGELEVTWLALLRALKVASARVELVTTNYDIVLEASVAALGRTGHIIETGRVGLVQPHLNVQLWRDAVARISDASAPGLLTKLHGSVDWSRGVDRIFVGDPTYKGSHERHVIIYPGFKGVPTTEPFASMHNYFELAASRAAALVFIGFAFRDDYVNEVLRRSAAGRAAVIIVNPGGLNSVDLPFKDGQYVHLRAPFTADVIDDIIANLPSAA